jgi:hypothetical protein
VFFPSSDLGKGGLRLVWAVWNVVSGFNIN